MYIVLYSYRCGLVVGKGMATRYTRRVQLVGGSTYVVSLPKDWARRVGIGSGSELELETLPDGSLLLRPRSGSESRGLLEYVVEVDENTDFNMLVRKVMAGYVAGFKSIRIVKKSVSAQKMVEKLVDVVHKRVLGLEVLDEDASSLLFQNIVDTSFTEIRGTLRRLVRVALTMHEDAFQCMVSRKECNELFQSVRERDNLADKLYLLILRQLVETGMDPSEAARQDVTMPETLFIASLAKNVERIADYATAIARIIVDSEEEIPGQIIELYGTVIGVLKRVLKAALEPSEKDIEEASRLSDEVKKRIKEVRSSYGYAVPYSTGLLLETLSRTIAHSIDILEAVLDMEALRQAIAPTKRVQRRR